MEKALEDCLSQAILNDDHQAVTQILLRGANPNKVTSSGKTCLGEAAHLGNLRILKMLLDVSSTSGQNKTSSNNSNIRKRHKYQKRKLSQGENFCKSKIKERKDGIEEFTTVKLDNQGLPDKNCGYFVCQHEEGSSPDDGSYILKSPVGSISLTPSPQDDLEWDEDIGSFASDTSDDETWSSMYRWYATVLERTGAALASASAVAGGIDNQDTYMRTALHYAADTANGAALQLLLDAGCKVDTPDARGMSALHLAIIKNNEEAVRMLLVAGTRVHNMTHENMTPLHFAASRGYVEIVNMLIKYGAHLESRDINERTPLYLASIKGHEDVVRYLIAAGANVNSEDIHGNTPLCEAVFKNYTSMVEILLRSGARIIPSHRLLYEAIIMQQEEIAKMLVMAMGDNNLHDEVGNTPLMLATTFGQYEIAKLLLENGANINLCNSTTGSTSLQIAAMCVEAPHLFEKFLLCFLKYKMDINFNSLSGDTALNRAIIMERDDTAFVLIKHGADVNLCDFKVYGKDNLAIVCQRRNTFLATLLIKAGHILPIVDYNCTNHVEGTTAHCLYHTCSLPLALNDLCRIKIRSMAKDMVMHKFVDSLPLPKSLKKFLMLDVQ